MKINDALATLDLLEESLTMLTHMRELDISSLAQTLARLGSPDAVASTLRNPRSVNLGNLTQDGKPIESQEAIQALDSALSTLNAPEPIRRAARIEMNKFWDTPRAGRRTLDLPSMPSPAAFAPAVPALADEAPPSRKYGTTGNFGDQKTQKNIRDLTPEDRARILKGKREAIRRKAAKLRRG